MRQYKNYMDHVKVSGDLHRRLAELEGPGKRPVPWVKYASLAAALALVCGLGVWGLGKVPGGPGQLAACFMPTVAPELGGLDEPDIALEEPGDAAQPGMRTLGGYEVAEDGAAAYYVLPYIEYGPPSGSVMNSSLARPDGELRDAGRDDVLALVGGEEALTAHLNWGECEFRGTVGFEADGTVCMMSLWGEGADTAFSLEVSPGRIPPTCYVVIGEERTITDVWGVEVSGVNRAGAYGDAERGVYMDVSRELQFIAKGVGCRLKVYGTQDQAVEELASRFVRWAVLEGLDLSAISPDGAKPVEAGPDYSVGEPNWDDSGEGWICPGCGAYIEAGVEHYHTQDGCDPYGYAINGYDPDEVADRGYDPGEVVPEADSWLTCRTCGGGVPDGTEHYCKPDGSGGYVCGLCGEAFPEGKVHSHEVCGLPLAPETWTCETCGETVQHGMAHDCTMCSGYPAPHICEMCGEAYPEGTAHACRQEGHHQGSHH